MKNNSEEIGDGARLVEGLDDSFSIVEADGSVSVQIQSSPKDTDKPFRVQRFSSTQQIIDAEGNFVARTIDPEMAKHICNMLIVFDNLKKRASNK